MTWKQRIGLLLKDQCSAIERGIYKTKYGDMPWTRRTMHMAIWKRPFKRYRENGHWLKLEQGK